MSYNELVQKYRTEKRICRWTRWPPASLGDNALVICVLDGAMASLRAGVLSTASRPATIAVTKAPGY